MQTPVGTLFVVLSSLFHVIVVFYDICHEYYKQLSCRTDI